MREEKLFEQFKLGKLAGEIRLRRFIIEMDIKSLSLLFLGPLLMAE